MELEEASVLSGKRAVLRNVLLAIAAVYVVASAYFIFETRTRVTSLEKAQQAAVEKLNERIAATDREVKASAETLAQKVGMTEQELKTRMAARSADLERQQRAAEKRLVEQQQERINKVSGEVAGVKTDLGSTRNDLAATRSDLEATKAKLERAVGDLGVQSGLVARTRDDLEELRRRGDRNIYEFTLQKGAKPTPVSTISLQLKKTDTKRNKFTLNVLADDRTIEKKDRTVAEPLQFYTGRERQLYEIVVFALAKKKATGYLATPKSAVASVAR